MFRLPISRELPIREEAPNVAASPAEAPALPVWRVLAIAFVIGISFYVIDHDFRTSLRESYGSDANELAHMTEGGNTSRRLAFFAIAGLGIIGWAQTQSQRSPRSLLGMTMMAVVAWAALSYFWSIDEDTTSRRWLVLLCAFIGAVGLGRWMSARDLCLIGVVVGLGSFCWGLAAELQLGTFHPLTSDYRFAGTLHPNTQGLYLACLTIGAFCLARSERRLRPAYWILVMVGIAALVLTKSRTATAATLIALGSIWSLQASWQLRLGAVFAVFGMIIVSLMLLLVSGVDLEEELQQAALLGRQEQSESLTGRLPIWIELSQFVAERPWTGHGYDTFWTADNIDTIAERVEWPIKEAHNGYIDLTLNIGLIGVSLVFAAAVMGVFAGASRFHSTENPATGIYVGLIVFSLLNCLTESGMIMPQFPGFLTACGLARLAFTEPNCDGRPE